MEEPGPWGEGGVPVSRLGAEVTTALRAVAAERGVKLLLVRRPDAARRDPGGERRLFLVDSRRGGSGVLTRRGPAAGLAGLAGRDEGWVPHPQPLLLVCTHGRKDWCCAVRGRPVAAALAELEPEQVWECSHLGGDRFAASVLALPSGVLHGRVDVTDVPALVAAVRRGRVLVDLLRGRTCDAVLVQAADVLVRRATGREELDALRPLSAGPVDGAEGSWRVRFAVRGGGELDAVLREGRAPAQRLTCSASGPSAARTWSLVSLTSTEDGQAGAQRAAANR